MQRGTLSAQGSTVLRLLESERPARERLFYDPYAALFANPLHIAWTQLLTRSGLAEWRTPGEQRFVQARTRYIDDYLFASLVGGARQLVILGAGYDARSFRFAEALVGRARVFEVDGAAIQRVKIRKLERVMGKLPPHVVFVPLNIETEPLLARLYAAGYAEGRKTLFIWEGATMYLSPQVVSATLLAISSHSGPGSRAILDYMHPPAGGTPSGGGASFVIGRGDAAAYLEQHGFCSVVDAGAAQLEARFFSQGPRRGGRVAPGYGIVSAAVAPRLHYTGHA
jgi:methyltransferase (TIGR00027 family)